MALDEAVTEPQLTVDLDRDKVEAAGRRSWTSSLDPAERQARASWAIDTSGRVTVAADPLGFHPLYYASAPTRFAVSPSLIALARSGVSKVLDDEALAVAARLGFFLGEDTPFAAIRALPVAGSLTWRNGTLRVSGGLPAIARSHSEQAGEVFAGLFHDAVGRRLPSSQHYALPLSGGRDSRHILLELIRHGRPPAVVFAAGSVPPTYANDALTAGQVAEELGVRHICWTPRAEDVTDELHKNVTTGLCTDEHGWFPAVSTGLSLLTDTYYDGIGGDVLSASQFLPTPVGRGVLANDPASVMGELAVLPEPILADILTADAYERLAFDRAVERLRTEMRRHADMPNPVASFFFFNRTRREVALLPYRLAAAAFPTVFTPFLDLDLVHWLLGLPSELSLGGRLHDDAIQIANPAAAGWPLAGAAPHAPKPSDGLTASTLRYITARPDGPLVRRGRLADLVHSAASRGERPWWVGLALLLLQIEEEANRSR